MQSALIDSGPLIALFAIDDKHHRRFDDLVGSLAGDGLRLLTTWPCIVEASYLLDIPQRYEMLHWVELGGALVYPFETHHLGDMIKWMQKYSNKRRREMDLADASLYWLAMETTVTHIMTIDIADFSRYRLPDGAAFTLLG
ncbi:MAG: type II toxin-antitoxin system VapC family toxin [Gammaproteobacteria bacterium]